MVGRSDEAEEEAKVLTFEDVKKLGKDEVTAYIACGGNKRKYLAAVYPHIKGLRWSIGAIGNAKYEGIYARKLLLEVMGLKEEELKGKHLVAVSTDADF